MQCQTEQAWSELIDQKEFRTRPRMPSRQRMSAMAKPKRLFPLPKEPMVNRSQARTHLVALMVRTVPSGGVNRAPPWQVV
jgi:hypothetical protein